MTERVALDIASTKMVRPVLARWGAINIVQPQNKSITRNYATTANDFDQINNAGLPVPDAAPTMADQGAGSLSGTYGYYVTFYDNNTGVEGAPSAIGSHTTTNQIVRVTNAATNNAANSRVTHWRIYRNVGGSIYYRVAEVVIGTTFYDDNNADADIQTNDTLNTNYTAPASNWGLCRVVRSYCFLAGCNNRYGGTDYDSNIVFSYANSVDQFPYWNDVDLEPGRGGIIRNLVEAVNALAVMKDSMIFIWQWDQNPHKLYGDGHIEQVKASRGCLNERTAVEDNGVAFVMDAQGIYQWDGDSAFIELSGALLKFWERINWSVRHTFHAVRDEKRIWFFVALDDDQTPEHAFIYDLQAHRAGGMGRWWVYKYNHSFVDSTRLEFHDDTVADAVGVGGMFAPVAMTATGHVFWLGVGLRDGVPLRHGKQHTAGERTRDATCTVASGTATSVTCATTHKFEDTFQSMTRDPRGCYIQFTNVPELTGAYRITSVSGASKETLNFPAGTFTGFTFDGDEEFIIGPIPELIWESPLHEFGDPSELKSIDEVFFDFEPLALDKTVRASHVRNRLGRPDWDVTVDEVGRKATDGDDFEELKLGGKVTVDGGRGWATHKVRGRSLHQLKLILGDERPVADLPLAIHSIDYRLM